MNLIDFILLLLSVIDKPLDLIYAIDISNQKNQQQYVETIREYIRKDLEMYRLSPTETRVAIIAFSDKPKVILAPGDGSHLKNVLESLPSRFPCLSYLCFCIIYP